MNTDSDLPHSIRIACASNDGQHIDGHFGFCPQFLIYQVSAEQSCLIATRLPETVSSAKDKNVYRAQLLQDCHILYSAEVGVPAAAKIIKTGIQPVKLSEHTAISALISELQNVLAHSPPPWLAKIMGVARPNHLAIEEVEA